MATSMESRVPSLQARVMSFAALAFFLSAPCAKGQNPPYQAESQDAHPHAKQAIIDSVDIHGYRRVSIATILKSISILPGGIYDPAKVAHDVEALKATGYFDAVRAETKAVFGAPGRMIVTFYLREKDDSASPGGSSPQAAPIQDEIGERYDRASELLWAGDLKEAQSEFEAVLEKKPDYRSAKTLLGLTLARLSGQSEDLGETSLAVAQLRQALAQDPNEAYWHSALAHLLHSQGNSAEAAKECAQAAKLSPDDADLARGCGFGPSPEIVNDAAILTGKDLAALPDFTVPIPINKPDPAYSEKARQARYQAAITLCVVVGVDGAVEQAAIVKPAGLGLDEAALRAVRTWTFKPATQNGTPVRTRITAEMTFTLF